VTEEPAAHLVERPFGEESRRNLLEEYFADLGEVSPSDAWKHVYRLLLWIDRTTGLAHCYESDKAQPGRPWYARSLAFHAWVADQLGTSPADLRSRIDWLFRRGLEKLTAAIDLLKEQRRLRAAEQRRPYADLGFPEPGRDPELEAILRDHLARGASAAPDHDRALVLLAERLQAYFLQENKRANLVGEGFEDVLSFLIRHMPKAGHLSVRTRPQLHDIYGFRPPPLGEKVRRVDLAITAEPVRRVLVTAKWSIRADREEQFGVDFDTYTKLEDRREPFDFVLVTNEFDAARLGAACSRWVSGRHMFSAIVHVNPDALDAVYAGERRGKAALLAEHQAAGRLISLREWLGSLSR
jgi:hypothetical protein